MAFQGFGKETGPKRPPTSTPSFGVGQQLHRPPSPSPSLPFVPSQRSPTPRRPEVSQRMQSPPLASESINPGWRPFPSAGVNRWNHGSKFPYKDYDAEVNQEGTPIHSVGSLRYNGAGIIPRVAQFQESDKQNSPLLWREDILNNSDQSVTRSHSGISIGNQNQPLPKRTQSPPMASMNNQKLESHNVYAGIQHQSNVINNFRQPVSRIANSPPSALRKNYCVDQFLPPGGSQRPALSSSAWSNHLEIGGNNLDVLTNQDMLSVSPDVASRDCRRSFQADASEIHGTKRTRPPVSPSATEALQNYSHVSRNNLNNLSPPSLCPSVTSHPSEAASMRPITNPAAKRTRSPPLRSSDQEFQANFKSSEDGYDREMQAKEKRLARFKVELEDKMPSSSGSAGQRVTNTFVTSGFEKRKLLGDQSMEPAGEFANGSNTSDYEDVESTVIMGLCPDMCPESERGERERKGDLDHYERIEGDRNRTSEYLAVKKYNRTAEREANLIRPMPVLQKTVDYLLSLVDQPYDDKFLGLYNFLWDRMRAIRMDLRMQHIFNEDAITMLEQMIRLHIIAMHELCEYTKGEGFSEGFDAHLNIEQMNKASVELFQMYDDHRQRGINVPTEKEFRGYYALLKLDKHPGYKVEPAELSLDLVKMTPEIRQTSEVVFARDVARACRTGNYIAFFRLARKATYLQGCLMHAHFLKLRTKALASLHSGLQSNQGIPVAQLSKWLAMEEEDIESLLEYHGFLIKEFEEPYMVKEGPFLNPDKYHPTKRSKLVLLKRSKTIIDDVMSSQVVSPFPKEEKKIQLGEALEMDSKTVKSVAKKPSVPATDEEMQDFGSLSSPKRGKQVMLETSTVGEQAEAELQVASPWTPTSNFTFGCSSYDTQPFIVNQWSRVDHQGFSPKLSFWNFSLGHISPSTQPDKNKRVEQPHYDGVSGKILQREILFGMGEREKIMPRATEREMSSSGGQLNRPAENVVAPTMVARNDIEMVTEDIRDEEPSEEIHEDHESPDSLTNNEVAEAKLKLILRLWKRRSSRRRQLREHRELAANSAMKSLSLGPPMRKKENQPITVGKFDIDNFMKERYEKHARSWARLNVSDVVACELGKKNSGARCLCWKIVVCSYMVSEQYKMGENCQVAYPAAGSWLCSKLMPTRRNGESDDELLLTSPGLLIWKKCAPFGSADYLTCLSCIRDARYGNFNETLSGASAVLFVVSEGIPWELQRSTLHNLLMSVPSGSYLPLLVLCGLNHGEGSDRSSIVEKLGLSDVDKSCISSFQVIFLVDNQPMEHSDVFFSDEKLRNGLRWLASESPPQPLLHLVDTRNLVLSHLNRSLEVTAKMSDYEVRPDHCISAFNEALDRSIEEIASTANANPNGWPFPEISLLEGEDDYILKSCLPSIGWSSPARVEPLIHALRDIRLPAFTDDISWLRKGSSVGIEIEHQRALLENCLTRYLTESSNAMGCELAAKEAILMLQKNTLLELHNSSYYLVPKWVMIFKRIINWRLMTLSRGSFASVYILEQHYSFLSTSSLDDLGHDSREYATLDHPSLDELVGVGCSTLLSGMDLPQLTASQQSVVLLNDKACEGEKTSDLIADNSLLDMPDTFASHRSNSDSGELVTTTKATGETANLNELLQHCNILQNVIEKKLSIYF